MKELYLPSDSRERQLIRKLEDAIDARKGAALGGVHEALLNGLIVKLARKLAARFSKSESKSSAEASNPHLHAIDCHGVAAEAVQNLIDAYYVAQVAGEAYKEAAAAAAEKREAEHAAYDQQTRALDELATAKTSLMTEMRNRNA